MVCPVWNGRNNKGQQVCADSQWTKRAGCNSAEDRVVVENAQRPQYAEYINLDAQGIRGNMYGMIGHDVALGQKVLDNVHNYTGSFGLQTGFQQNIYPSCINSSTTPYEFAMAQEAQNLRNRAAANNGYTSNNYRQASGCAGM